MKLGLNHISAIAAILDLANMVAPLSACFSALKNEFRMFWSTCLPNFMLVEKSAQYLPNK